MSRFPARHVWVLSLLCAAAPVVVHAAPPSSVERAHQALLEARVEEAAHLLASAPEGPDTRYVQALVRFHQGDYAGALRSLDASIAAAPLGKDDDRRSLRELLVATRDATKDFVTAHSPDGRFEVSHAPGPDAVLVPYAFEALRAADDVLARELGVRMPAPVRLEIYPTPESLAQVSTLSVEAIERTGTIALCKWDRLMITSPRALVRGYPWMDTIAHEFVHLVLTRASRDEAPVWFQEGVAKFLERAWRGEQPAAHLDPATAALLHDARMHGRLIPFERLHPSIALLPSQQDAALAFAQVATFIETFYQSHGARGLQHAIARMAEGMDARKALSEVAGERFARLESDWKASLADRTSPVANPPDLPRMRFKKGGHMDDSLEVEGERARKVLRLGDLLWDRSRPKAAAAEYAKAHALAPDDPIVASRLARAALRAGDATQALSAIGSVLSRYPDYEPAHAVRGAALLAQGKRAEAAEASREAIRLNPFDPQPHCDLGVAAAGKKEQEGERAQCSRLGGPAGP